MRTPSFSARSAALLMALAVGNSGCGILLQTAFGWSDERTERTSKTHNLQIDAPEGAQVTRAQGGGEPESIGTGSFTDQLSYTQEVTRTEPKTAGLWIGGGISFAAGVAMAVAATGSSSCDFDDEFCFEDVGTSVGLLTGGGLFITAALTDFIVAAIHGLASDGVTGQRVIGENTYTYVAQKGGERYEQRAAVPGTVQVRLLAGSTPAAPVVTSAPPPPPPPPATSGSGGFVPAAGNLNDYVIAVMDVEDVNKGTRKGLDRGLVRNLGDQLRIFIAQRGARTVDRRAQEQAFREQLAQAKSESYKACYDDACQIELGKALAASHILRSRITRFGSRCVLNAELIDLRAEVTIKAASAQGGCEAEGFLTMSEDVARDVTGR